MNGPAFRAYLEPSGEWGLLKLRCAPDEGDEVKDKSEIDRLVEFLRQKRDYERKHGGIVRALRVYFEVWYKRRTPNQWRLYAELVDRRAAADGVAWKEVHRGIKWKYYPREGEIGQRVPKSSDELSTVEMAHVIEGALIECMNEPSVDVRDIYTLWQEWRGKQERDPLEGMYASIEEYVSKHPFCEACGRGLGNDEWDREGQMDHIVPVSEGGPDEPENRLRLCTDCHLLIKHDDGCLPLIFTYPAVRPKVLAAWKRYGKAGLEERIARVGGEVSAKVDKQNELDIF